MKRTFSVVVLVALLASLLLTPLGAGAAPSAVKIKKTTDALDKALSAEVAGTLNILVQTTTQDYAGIVAAITEAGGTVTRQFKYASGLAATVPPAAIQGLMSIDGVTKMSLDTIRTPGPSAPLAAAGPDGLGRESASGLDKAVGAALPVAEGFGTFTFDAADLGPENYWNPLSMNAYPVWDTGNMGQDSLIVVIDTGIYDQHFMLAGSVVGGVDISADVDGPYEGWNEAWNHWHGTHVSGIAAGHGAIIVPNDDSLVEAIEYYSGATLPAAPPPDDATHKIIPLLGMAPMAELYGIKVFPHDGSGAPESTIIAGIEYAIDMHMSGEYDVDVINMSLGGGTLFDGRDLEDQVVDYATSVGIAVATSAGNAGPFSISTGSPGTANTAITVGSAATPVQTQVFWDEYYGMPGVGEYLYVDDNPQVYASSSRGPTTDGRDKPTVVATGVYVLSSFNTEAAPQSIAWASGTSMASPAVAGITALLNTYGEAAGASPYDYKEALIAGATPLPGYDKYDQGAGYVDAAASMAALMADPIIGSPHPELPEGYAAVSVQPKGTFIQAVNGGPGVTFDVSLAPGMAEHYYFNLHPNAEKIIIDFTNVDYGVDPVGMNSFEVYLQGGIRSVNNAYIDTTNVWGDAHFEVADMSTTASGTFGGAYLFDLPLMPGYFKFVVENDWTSFDTVSGTVTIKVETGNNSAKPDEDYFGFLNTDEDTGFFPVGFGPNGVRLDLSWKNNWKRYPASDMDMIVAWWDTDGGGPHIEFGGATLNAPETVIIDSTKIDSVIVLVAGYQTFEEMEKWQLDVWYR